MKHNPLCYFIFSFINVFVRQKLWDKNGYDSCNLPLEEDSEDEDEVVAMTSDEDGSGDSRAIHYVVGDVTHPTYAGGKDAIVVHCVGECQTGGYL